MNYRTIYENYKGPIPVDDDGRSYDIHHIDGNRANNTPTNLIALSLQEHYDIHYQQNDWMACHAISLRLKLSPDTISELSKRTQKERIKKGTHHFLNSKWQSEQGKKANEKRLLQGTHNLIGPDMNKELVKKGIHPGQKERICPHCGLVGKGPWMFQKHFNNCKDKT